MPERKISQEFLKTAWFRLLPDNKKAMWIDLFIWSFPNGIVILDDAFFFACRKRSLTPTNILESFPAVFVPNESGNAWANVPYLLENPLNLKGLANWRISAIKELKANNFFLPLSEHPDFQQVVEGFERLVTVSKKYKVNSLRGGMQGGRIVPPKKFKLQDRTMHEVIRQVLNDDEWQALAEQLPEEHWEAARIEIEKEWGEPKLKIWDELTNRNERIDFLNNLTEAH